MIRGRAVRGRARFQVVNLAARVRVVDDRLAADEVYLAHGEQPLAEGAEEEGFRSDPHAQLAPARNGSEQERVFTGRPRRRLLQAEQAARFERVRD